MQGDYPNTETEANAQLEDTGRTHAGIDIGPPRGEPATNASAEPQVSVVKKFWAALRASGESFFLADQVQQRLRQFLASEPDLDARTVRSLRRMFRGCIEILLDTKAAYAVLRPGAGLKRIICLEPGCEQIKTVDRGRYLEVKDAYLQGHEEASKSGLVLDFSPFFRGFPKVNETAEMGEGISFLNRRLSAQMHQDSGGFRRMLLGFLRDRDLDGRVVLVNDRLGTPERLLEELAAARSELEDFDPDESCESIAHELRIHGLECGWGSSVETVSGNLRLLSKVLESSDPERFERLLDRLPLIRAVLMVSPHGWFAQDSVLGKPDTGGQVTYVLDQARALEAEMRRRFSESGIDATPTVIILTRLIPSAEDTTCNVQRERILGTQNSWILRIPFRDSAGEIIPGWISRFYVWPFLEQFAREAEAQVVREFLGKPDLIIGHYSDGNLVAHRLADSLGVTHCACAHALEKTKYLFSDMHWADMESEYNFSLQFTADLIGYNSADFIVCSSSREIGGTATELGMIESYELFSMPGLYRVQSGLDPRLARHNIVPPGASEEHFFPNDDRRRRVEAVTLSLTGRFLEKHPSPGCLGELSDPELPPIFAMARMDRIKNLPGLVEIYGKSPTLREKANLLLITSVNDASHSADFEESEQVALTHELIRQYDLEGHVRWGAGRLDKVETGEIYRIAADRRGVFTQPALMETFGLTVVEAMACGLPVVVTCFGGPSEIVITGRSGAIENPNDHEAFANALETVVTDSEVWNGYAQAGIRRVQEAFTWVQHAEKVLRLANVYTYWNHVDVMNRQALDRYIHTLYHTIYRPRAQALLHRG